MEKEDFTEKDISFINGCVSRKGKVSILDNSIECQIEGKILVKKRDKPNMLRENNEKKFSFKNN